MKVFKIEIACKSCNKNFVKYISSATKYCSRKCYYSCIVPWCKGLTKETDNRVKKLSESVKNNHHDCSGKNNSMFGKKGELSPNWNPNREEIRMRSILRGMCKSLLHRALPKSKFGKINKTEKMLGYSKHELKIHLEKQFVDGMTWENYGDKEGCWHIDHIRPVASFPVNSDVSEINDLKNLRPLWRDENHKKWKKWQQE